MIGAIAKNFIKINQLIKKHWVAVAMAVATGLIIILPPLIFRQTSEYQGIDLFATDGESSYIAQVRAVYNGDFSFGNVFLYEYKDQPYVKQPLPAIVMAGLGKVLFLSVPNAIIAAKFVFPVLTFFFVYGLCLALTRDKRMSVLGASLIMFAPATTAWLDPRAWFSIITNGTFPGSEPQFLFYSRPISPQVSNVFFFAYLYFLWSYLAANEVWSVGKKRLYMILAAFILGLTFYTYLFAYTLLFAMNGFLALYFLTRKNWPAFKDLCLISIGGLIVGIPYFINMYQVFNSVYYPELGIRVGQVASREFIFSTVWLGVTLVVLLLYRQRDLFFAFCVSLLTAIFAVSNQQIVTGRTIPIPEHYHWYYMAPIGSFILVYVVSQYIKKVKSGLLWSTLSILIVIVSLISGVLFQMWSYSEQKELYLSLQEYGPAMNWLSKNSTKNDVVFASKDFSEQVVVFTLANVYYSGYGFEALVPKERIHNTLYVYLYLDGLTADNAKAYFAEPTNQEIVSNRVYGNYWRAKNGCYACYPKEINEQFINEYQAFYQEDFIKNLKKYRITYAVWDKERDPDWKFERFFTDVVFDDGRMRIYRVAE